LSPTRQPKPFFELRSREQEERPTFCSSSLLIDILPDRNEIS